MDINRWLYVGRTRKGDDTGNQIEVIYYGQDRDAYDVNKEYDQDDGLTARYARGGSANTTHSYYDSLEVKLPDNMTFVTYHKTYHAEPPKNTAMSCFFF